MEKKINLGDEKFAALLKDIEECCVFMQDKDATVKAIRKEKLFIILRRHLLENDKN